jgi:hypothetical protein
MRKNTDKYEDLIRVAPELEKRLVPEQCKMWQANNKSLRKTFGKLWKKNLRKNCERLFKKHGPVTKDCVGIGINKAVIAIGAGASFNKNKDLLKELYSLTITLPPDQQPFLFVSCNHQFKPLLEMGIAPHFVVVLDGTEVVYDQLCKNIPRHGRGTTLLCPLRVHRNVTHEWDRQGRSIRFYMGDNSWMMAEFKKVMGYDPSEHKMIIGHGGNVMNQILQLGMHHFRSTVHMCVGNDLSYEYNSDLGSRRDGYYADGNYSTNIATGRDEAKRVLPWMGYELTESILVPGKIMVKFVPRATTYQLMIYKNWVEDQLTVQSKFATAKFHYYNCSEQGILGVMSRKKITEIEQETMVSVIQDKNNWYMLDEELPKRYHTRTLAHAANEFITAREQVQKRKDMLCHGPEGILSDAGDAEALLARMGFVRTADPRHTVLGSPRF